MPSFSNHAEPVLELGLDPLDGVTEPFAAGHVVRGRIDDEFGEGVDPLAGERVDDGDRRDLVAEQLDTQRRLVVGRLELDGVAPDAERAPREAHVVAVVPHVDELAQDVTLVVLLADLQDQQVVAVLLG